MPFRTPKSAIRLPLLSQFESKSWFSLQEGFRPNRFANSVRNGGLAWNAGCRKSGSFSIRAEFCGKSLVDLSIIPRGTAQKPRKNVASGPHCPGRLYHNRTACRGVLMQKKCVLGAWFLFFVLGYLCFAGDTIAAATYKAPNAKYQMPTPTPSSH